MGDRSAAGSLARGALAAGLFLVLSTTARPAPLMLVRNGASDYSIYHEAAAPESVAQAASELQRVVKAASGVSLPIVERAGERAILLGDSLQARQAGIHADSLPDDGYILRTQGTRLFIVGRDLRPGEEPWDFQTSQGTYLGVCRFLEDVVGARWLVPGPWGEEIPTLGEIALPDVDLTAGPRFAGRSLKDLHDTDPAVAQWRARHGLQARFAVGWGHSFDDHPDVAVLQQHPEYLALQADGQRLDVPQGKPYRRLPTWKYCLTNPGLVEAFAESLNRSFDRRPKRLCDSMSPSDGPYWCTCEACRKGTMPVDPARWPGANPKAEYRTPGVLEFYNRVARLVAQKHPERIVGAMAYQHYLYPPETVVRLEPNILLGIASSNGYGFKFYKPDRAGELRELLAAWSRFSDRLGYSDYSTWMRNWFGFPLPCGRSILKLVFPALGASRVQYVNYFGIQAWGYGAPSNYLVAKLLWDPTADVDGLYREFLQRAYGPVAAVPLERMDSLLDDALQAYIRATPNPDHELDYAMIKAVWAPRWDHIERLYGEAQAGVQTAAQGQRLSMLGDNLVMAHYHLRKAGLAEAPEKSPFYRTDEQFAAFLQEHKDSLALVDVAGMVKHYHYPEMPVLAPGWRPK